MMIDPEGLSYYNRASCVALCTVAGGAVGGIVGGLVGAGGGALGGTLVAPGFGTLSGALAGANASLAPSISAGTNLGFASGLAFCPNDTDESYILNSESGPKTGNAELDKALKGSSPGDSNKGWKTAGTKESLEAEIKKIPGAIQTPTSNGGSVTVLPDGTRINIYPERGSVPGKAGWQVIPPGSSSGSQIKGTLGN